jgi:hypothetical protein
VTLRSHDSHPSAIHTALQDAAPLTDALWDSASSLQSYIDGPIANQELWRTTTRLAKLSEEALARAASIGSPMRLIALVEDWCGDAMYTVPFAQRIVEANDLLSLRVLRRDLHDALMDTHRTNGSRSIPVIISFDESGAECAWWGPRPSPLQEWVIREGLSMEKPARYKAIRTWYARDRGETTVHELLSMLERPRTQDTP